MNTERDRREIEERTDREKERKREREKERKGKYWDDSLWYCSTVMYYIVHLSSIRFEEQLEGQLERILKQ